MKLIKYLKKYIKNPLGVIYALGKLGWFKWVPDRIYLKLIYRGETGKTLKLNNPKTFNEKLQWLKLYDRKPEYSIYVDKYEVRSYIERTIGKEYLIPLIGLYNKVDEIKWDKLPQRFVIKCTHGSGTNIICTDKDKLDLEEAKKKLRKWMKKNWYWSGREWPYKNVKPRIICEEFISENDDPPMDYKVLCFNGKAKLIEVHINRFGNHKQDFYTIDWNKTNISQKKSISSIVLDKPLVLDKMIELSEMLARDKYHVRIDWYVIFNKLYFGEITFYDGSGLCPFDSEDDDLLLGNMLVL